MSLPHLIETFSTRLKAEIEPLGMKMGAMTLSPRGPGRPPKHVMAQVGPDATPVSLQLSGWGGQLELRDIRFETALDNALGFEAAAELAVAILANPLSGQRILHAAASAAGLTKPLEGDERLSTAHLSVDPDAVATLAAHLGPGVDVRGWIEAQIGLYISEETVIGRTGDEKSVIRIVRDHLHLPFTLSPLKPARGAGDTKSPVWEDDSLYLQEHLPEMTADLLVGRWVDALVAGTPIGHRIITAVSVPGAGIVDDGDTVVVMETPRVRIDALLPRGDAR